jgi:hypothetical protein
MSLSQNVFALGNTNPSTNDGTVTIKGGYITFGGANNLASVPPVLRNSPLNAERIKNGFFTFFNAEVLRVITITPTAVANTDYRITLSTEKGQQFDNNLPNEVQTVFTHTTPASGATPDTIGNAFRAAINNHPYWGPRVTVTGTGTIIITADAGFPIFSAAGGPNLATVVSTAGSPQTGLSGAALLATGAFSADTGLPVSGTNYGVCVFEAQRLGESVLSAGGEIEKFFIYFPSNAGAVVHANQAQLLTQLQAVVVK